MKFRLALVGLGTSALTVIAACGNGPPPDSVTGAGTGTGGGATVALVTTGTAAVKVTQSDALKFDPGTVSVKAGDVVAFTNGGTIGHNVTFDAGAATNGVMVGGDTVLFKFTAAGSYHYVCTIHPGMEGSVTVG